MLNRRLNFLLPCFLIFSSSTAQEVGFAAHNDLGFFELLTLTFRASEAHLSFEDAVAMSTVIGRGYLADVIPGRKISNKALPPDFPAQETVLLRVTALNAIKGDYRSSYYVEYPISQKLVGELREKIYTGELLFLLRPAGTFYAPEVAEISISREAESALGDQPIYEFTQSSTLFIMSPDNKLTSPLQFSDARRDLYTDIRSLDDLESRIVAIQSSNE